LWPIDAPGDGGFRIVHETKRSQISLLAGIVACCTTTPPAIRPPTDIQMTKAILDLANRVGISVHDHIIVGQNGHAGLRGLQFIQLCQRSIVD
jgi:hypothetical protein